MGSQKVDERLEHSNGVCGSNRHASRSSGAPLSGDSSSISDHMPLSKAEIAIVEDGAPNSTPGTQKNCTQRAIALAKKYNLVICFIIAIVVGLTYPAPGVAASFEHGGEFGIFCVPLWNR